MRITTLIAAAGIAAGGIATHSVTAKADPLSDLAGSSGNDAKALIRLGNLYVEAERLTEAKKAYKKARQKNKDAPEAELGIIKISMVKNSFQKSKHLCRKLARDNPKSSVGDICSGKFWLVNERASRAVEEFEKATAKGDIVRGKTGIADALRLAGRWDEATAAYREALDAGAGYEALLGAALASEQKGDIAQATQFFKKAAAAEPASCLAHYHYGRILGKGDEAIKQLSIAVAIRPNWFDALLALGETHARNNEHEKAVDAYRQAIEKNKSPASPYFGLAQSLRALKRNDETLAALREVTSRIPNHVGAHLLLAEIFHEQKQPDKAVEALDRARDSAPGDVNVLIRSAEIYCEVGRFTNARAFLNRALSIKPGISKAHAMLGDIACRRRLFDEGREHYEAALKGDLKGIDKAALKKKKAACQK